ncbi:hypothetical protein BX661DRAFT_29540 [Kickxella alabastrina]|uniref:uncharacterized protein n=1 Tax=Kickxella alabastrina TaxID=61397 RepID=UPI002221053F|nr:uncharacterized protein BX661DRAFT_29540 [Kickxella alabastrina]KAI7826700.1 hypothetical protein BX661DRAFT_29540 [Kickxella alabastrina]
MLVGLGSQQRRLSSVAVTLFIFCSFFVPSSCFGLVCLFFSSPPIFSIYGSSAPLLCCLFFFFLSSDSCRCCVDCMSTVVFIFLCSKNPSIYFWPAIIITVVPQPLFCYYFASSSPPFPLTYGAKCIRLIFSPLFFPPCRKLKRIQTRSPERTPALYIFPFSS